MPIKYTSPYAPQEGNKVPTPQVQTPEEGKDWSPLEREVLGMPQKQESGGMFQSIVDWFNTPLTDRSETTRAAVQSLAQPEAAEVGPNGELSLGGYAKAFLGGALEGASKPSTIAQAASLGTSGPLAAAMNVPTVLEGFNTATDPSLSTPERVLGTVQGVTGLAGGGISAYLGKQDISPLQAVTRARRTPTGPISLGLSGANDIADVANGIDTPAPIIQRGLKNSPAMPTAAELAEADSVKIPTPAGPKAPAGQEFALGRAKSTAPLTPSEHEYLLTKMQQDPKGEVGTRIYGQEGAPRDASIVEAIKAEEQAAKLKAQEARQAANTQTEQAREAARLEKEFKQADRSAEGNFKARQALAKDDLAVEDEARKFAEAAKKRFEANAAAEAGNLNAKEKFGAGVASEMDAEIEAQEAADRVARLSEGLENKGTTVTSSFETKVPGGKERAVTRYGPPAPEKTEGGATGSGGGKGSASGVKMDLEDVDIETPAQTGVAFESKKASFSPGEEKAIQTLEDLTKNRGGEEIPVVGGAKNTGAEFSPEEIAKGEAILEWMRNNPNEIYRGQLDAGYKPPKVETPTAEVPKPAQAAAPIAPVKVKGQKKVKVDTGKQFGPEMEAPPVQEQAGPSGPQVAPQTPDVPVGNKPAGVPRQAARGAQSGIIPVAAVKKTPAEVADAHYKQLQTESKASGKRMTRDERSNEALTTSLSQAPVDQGRGIAGVASARISKDAELAKQVESLKADMNDPNLTPEVKGVMQEAIDAIERKRAGNDLGSADTKVEHGPTSMAGSEPVDLETQFGPTTRPLGETVKQAKDKNVPVDTGKQFGPTARDMRLSSSGHKANKRTLEYRNELGHATPKEQAELAEYQGKTPAKKSAIPVAATPATVKPASPETPAIPAADAAKKVTNELRRVVDVSGTKNAKEVHERVLKALNEELAQVEGQPEVSFQAGKAYGGREGTVYLGEEPIASIDRYGSVRPIYGVDEAIAASLPKQLTGVRDATPGVMAQEARAQINAAVKGSKGGKFTLEIPGDGEFTIARDPFQIKNVIARVQKGGAKAWEGLSEVPKKAKTKSVIPVEDLQSTKSGKLTGEGLRNSNDPAVGSPRWQAEETARDLAPVQTIEKEGLIIQKYKDGRTEIIAKNGRPITDQDREYVRALGLDSNPQGAADNAVSPSVDVDAARGRVGDWAKEKVASLSPEELEASKQRIAEAKAKKSDPEAGFGTVEQNIRLAGSGIGAAAGGVMGAQSADEEGEDPTARAILGAILGGTAGYMAKDIPGALKNPVEAVKTIRDGVKQAVAIFPDYQRGSLLFNLPNLLINAIAGPYGSAIMGSLEHALSGDARGLEALKKLASLQFAKGFGRGFVEAGERAQTAVGRGEMSHALEKSPRLVRDVISLPGRFLTSGDISARDLLMSAGFTADEAKAITLTDEPSTNFAKAITDIKRGPGAKSWGIQTMFPFVRTVMNQVEGGLERLPMTGLSSPGAQKSLVLAQKALGTGVLGGSFALGMVMPADPALSPLTAKVLGNIGGQYGTIAIAAFAAGQATQAGDENALTKFIDSFAYGIPLPTTRAVSDVTNMAEKVIEGNFEPTEDMPTGIWPQALRPQTGAAITNLAKKAVGIETKRKRPVRRRPRPASE